MLADKQGGWRLTILQYFAPFYLFVLCLFIYLILIVREIVDFNILNSAVVLIVSILQTPQLREISPNYRI
jgi:hypothetical protein